MTKKIGRYEVIRELGHDGMGVVFLGRDPAVNRPVVVILNEMLSGEQPYRADTPANMIMVQLTEPPPTLNVAGLDRLPEWNDVIAGALARHPDERFATPDTLMAKVSQLATLPHSDTSAAAGSELELPTQFAPPTTVGSARPASANPAPPGRQLWPAILTASAEWRHVRSTSWLGSLALLEVGTLGGLMVLGLAAALPRSITGTATTASPSPTPVASAVASPAVEPATSAAPTKTMAALVATTATPTLMPSPTRLQATPTATRRAAMPVLPTNTPVEVEPAAVVPPASAPPTEVPPTAAPPPIDTPPPPPTHTPRPPPPTTEPTPTPQ